MKDVAMVLCAKEGGKGYAAFQRVGMPAKLHDLTPESEHRLVMVLYKYAEYGKVDRIEPYGTSLDMRVHHLRRGYKGARR